MDECSEEQDDDLFAPQKEEKENPQVISEILGDVEDLYYYIVNNIDEIVLIVSKTGKILFGNRRAFEVSGYTEEELIGKSMIKLLTKDAILQGMNALRHELLGLAEYDVVLDFKSKSGEIKTLEFAPGSAFVSKNGKTVGILVTAREKRAEVKPKSEPEAKPETKSKNISKTKVKKKPTKR